MIKLQNYANNVIKLAEVVMDKLLVNAIPVAMNIS